MSAKVARPRAGHRRVGIGSAAGTIAAASAITDHCRPRAVERDTAKTPGSMIGAQGKAVQGNRRQSCVLPSRTVRRFQQIQPRPRTGRLENVAYLPASPVGFTAAVTKDLTAPMTRRITAAEGIVQSQALPTAIGFPGNLITCVTIHLTVRISATPLVTP